MYLLLLSPFVVAYIIYSYNKIVRLEQSVLSSRGDLMSMVERRNLIIAEISLQIKDGSAFESALQSSVARIRETSTRIDDNAMGGAENYHATSPRIAVAEGYPSITSTQQRSEFQTILTQAELTIQKRTETYNTRVDRLNSYIRSFPPIVVAPLLLKRPYPYIETISSVRSVAVK